MKTGSAAHDLDYLSHLAADSARFVEALAQTPPEPRVPTCPGWDADDLLWHLGQVQWFWAAVIGRGLTVHAEVENLDNGGRPAGRDGLLAFFGQASDDLRHNLAAASPQGSALTWSQDQTVGFIRRRQAHEALIHRIDAELTAGDRTPMDPDLRTDGVEERCASWMPNQHPRLTSPRTRPLQCGSRPPIPAGPGCCGSASSPAEGKRHGP